MAQKDYVRRSKTASSRRKKGNGRQAKGASALMIGIAVVVLLAFISGLFFLAHQHKSARPVPAAQKTPHNGLPPKPEERWRYIKELENRKPGVVTPSKPTSEGNVNQRQLTDEQRQLLDQIQADMRQPPTQLNEVPWNGQPSATPKTDNTTAPATATPATTTPATTAPKTDHPATAPKTPPAPQAAGRWLVQCGSFKNADQAEAVRAQLAFEGFESHISASDGWQRVVVGPFSSKARVDAALDKLKASGHNQCIRLQVGD